MPRQSNGVQLIKKRSEHSPRLRHFRTNPDFNPPNEPVFVEYKGPTDHSASDLRQIPKIFPFQRDAAM